MAAKLVMLTIWMMSAGASTKRKMNGTGRPLWTAAVRDPERRLSIDWLDLLDVFLETVHSHRFREYVIECIHPQ